jgi:3-oxoacyl-[acyl-carrier-protein] synthase II
MFKHEKIVITGVGVISNIGVGKAAFWEGLRNGANGVSPITLFDPSKLGVALGGQASSFDAKNFFPTKGLRLLDRSTLLASAAAKLAIEDGALNIDDNNRCNMGIVLGATMGSAESIVNFYLTALQDGPHYVNPALFPNTVCNSPASQVAIRFSIKGLNSTLATGFSASLDAISHSVDFLRLGSVEAVLAGGVEELCKPMLLVFLKTGLLAHSEPESVQTPMSCPFDKRRRGFVFGEGSAIVLLERLQSALNRQARIYAEISGIGSSIETQSFRAKGSALKRAMEKALKDASLTVMDIDYICANANSTQEADEIESKAIQELFGHTSHTIPVSAIKSMISETYSASGALALASALGSIEQAFIPPTINYLEKDPTCPLDFVPSQTLRKTVNHVMINTMNPDGSSVSLIVSKINNFSA